jgi:hypothetical protein
MLTVKQITSVGYEVVMEAEEVHFVPSSVTQVLGGVSEDRVDLRTKNSLEPFSFERGNIFVMNAAGKTVARYCLEKLPASETKADL